MLLKKTTSIQGPIILILHIYHIPPPPPAYKHDVEFLVMFKLCGKMKIIKENKKNSKNIMRRSTRFQSIYIRIYAIQSSLNSVISRHSLVPVQTT